MTKLYNIKIVVSSGNFSNTMEVGIKIKEFLKKEYGEEGLADVKMSPTPWENGLYYCTILLNTTAKEAKEDANNRDR